VRTRKPSCIRIQLEIRGYVGICDATMLRCSVACLVRQFECSARSLGFEAILRIKRRTLENELMLQLLKLLIMKDATRLNGIMVLFVEHRSQQVEVPGFLCSLVPQLLQ
jgi:hypothetical protein